MSLISTSAASTFLDHILNDVLTIRCLLDSVMLVLKSHWVFITLLHMALASRSYANKKLRASFSSVLFPCTYKNQNKKLLLKKLKSKKKTCLNVSGVGG